MLIRSGVQDAACGGVDTSLCTTFAFTGHARG
jgi:hypothetical protein